MHFAFDHWWKGHNLNSLKQSALWAHSRKGVLLCIFSAEKHPKLNPAWSFYFLQKGLLQRLQSAFYIGRRRNGCSWRPLPIPRGQSEWIKQHDSFTAVERTWPGIRGSAQLCHTGRLLQLSQLQCSSLQNNQKLAEMPQASSRFHTQ